MSANTKIEWADHTFNPWIGCTKIGPACDNCYAEADFDHRRHVVSWGAGQPRKRTAPSTWAQPLRWNAEAERLGIRYRVFCASLADVFDNEVPPEWRRDLFNLILSTPHLDWLLLTKRIGNVEQMVMSALRGMFHGSNAEPPTWPWPNVWLGATICNQSEADRDIPKLLAVPAVKRFVSVEPMLGPVALTRIVLSGGVFDALRGGDVASGSTVSCWPHVDWVIVGGESGPKARPMHPYWVRSIRDQCADAGVPFFMKQWGEWVPRSSCYHTFEDGKSLADIDPIATRWPCIRLTERGHDGSDIAHAGEGNHAYMQRVGKKAAGRLLDGVEHNGFPESAVTP